MPPKTKNAVPKPDNTVKDPMVNPYELKSMKKYIPCQKNVSKHLHEMSAIFRSVVCGATGSGKTSYVTNLLNRYQNHFNRCIIFTAESEPIYDWLQSQIPSDMLQVYYNDLSPLEGDLKDFFYGSTLVILDDMVTKNKRQLIPVIDLFIRGRKLHNGVSLCFLTQSYFDIPPIIRKQLNYCVLVKINTNGDLRRILAESSLNCTKEQLYKMYDYCCNTGFGNVMTIDKQSKHNEGKTFRRNFLEFLDPNDFN